MADVLYESKIFNKDFGIGMVRIEQRLLGVVITIFVFSRDLTIILTAHKKFIQNLWSNFLIKP